MQVKGAQGVSAPSELVSAGLAHSRTSRWLCTGAIDVEVEHRYCRLFSPRPRHQFAISSWDLSGWAELSTYAVISYRKYVPVDLPS